MVLWAKRQGQRQHRLFLRARGKGKAAGKGEGEDSGKCKGAGKGAGKGKVWKALSLEEQLSAQLSLSPEEERNAQREEERSAQLEAADMDPRC